MSGAATFWDRRRAAVKVEEAAEVAAVAATAEAEVAPKTDAEILAELELPDPDDLKAGDDFKGFMSKAVPEHLRKRALRKLWRSNPVLACVDGLNDYDADYLTGSTGNGKIATTYQVGKGLLAHILEMERQAEPQDPVEVIEDKGEEVEVAAAEEPEVQQPEAPDEAVALRPRRMQFQFDGKSA